MNSEEFARETADVEAKLPPGPRVAVIGSTSFWHEESKATCIAVGRSLADLDDVILVTGGVAGAGEVVGRSFWAAREGRGRNRNVYHVLPRGCSGWDYGVTLFAGSHMSERREILGRLAEVYVAIEGGPGTAHEASVALARSVVMIPVGRSGGHSADLYSRVPRPPFVSEPIWRTLASSEASPTRVAAAVVDVVRAYLRGSTGSV